MRARRRAGCMPVQASPFCLEGFGMVGSPHELRHDPLTARAVHTLREVEAHPLDWIEPPRRGARRLVAANDEPRSAFARLVHGVAAIVLGAGALAGLVTLVEALR
jgi:hypothetical protein